MKLYYDSTHGKIRDADGRCYARLTCDPLLADQLGPTLAAAPATQAAFEATIKQLARAERRYAELVIAINAKTPASLIDLIAILDRHADEDGLTNWRAKFLPKPNQTTP